MTKIVIPASADAVVAELSGLGRLITAKKWERSALVASVVRLGDGQGTSSRTGRGFESARDFAARGIVGLSGTSSVTKYVQAWLDTHDGTYPRLGAAVVLPDGDFPPTRTGTDGDRTVDGMERRLSSLVEQHGLDAVQDVLDDIEPKTTSKTKPAPTLDDRWARWLTRMNALMVTGARLADESEAPDVVLGVYADAGRVLYSALVERRIDAELRDMLKGGV